MADVVFVDTSILLNLLDVPGKSSDKDTVVDEFRSLVAAQATLIIPIAAVVEVGNHIAQLANGRYRKDRAERFQTFLRASLDGQLPWVVSGASWDEPFLEGLLAGEHPVPGLSELAQQGVGSGDASILQELNRYRSRSDLPTGLPVRLWTLDTSLAAYA